MKFAPRPFEVRELVLRTFRDLGVSPRHLLDIDETILIDNGDYVARTYRLGGMMAMWFVGGGVVQFYDAAGNMLRTINLFEEMEPEKMAA
jgi:hypothetical protein